MIEELQAFANDVNKKWKAFPKVQALERIIEDIQNSRNSKLEELTDLKNDFGIYVFFIKPSIPFSNAEQLEKLWKEEGFKNYPQIVKKRFEAQECCEAGWFNLYVGKGENLKRRVEEHLNHHSNHATYSLKLKERKVFLNENEIEIGFWHLPPMPEVPREIKQFIITNMESQLRDKMQPWIGKQ